MIAQNNIIRAWLQVIGFWYVVGIVIWWWHGDYLLSSIASVGLRSLLQSAVVVVVGAGLGLFGALAWKYVAMVLREKELQEGERDGGATVLLGTFPAYGMIEHDPKLLREAHAILSETPWWPKIAPAAPAHADAIASVLALMLRTPSLPASPVPGGHGGRTLIEHSLAVVESMLRMAGKWEYRGQFDKRGRLRVPLTDPDTPHRFATQDAALLILTALAHDIGKVACYEPTSKVPEPGTRTVLVKEVRPNHDTEGGKLLRRLPEVMALPEQDRDALLLAASYYHHAFAIPISPWVTDRMRSLTELLIAADIATGKAEGHTLMEYADDEGMTDAPAQPAYATPAQPQAIPQDEATDAEDGSPSSREWPALARAFKALAAKPGAIGGKHKSTRIGVRRGNWIAVIEQRFRLSIGSTLVHFDPLLARDMDAMKQEGNNMAPITAALLEWAAEAGMLYQEHAGRTYGPRRALFRVRYQVDDAPLAGPDAKGVVAFLLDARMLGLESTPEAKQVEVLGPYWGENSARGKAGAAQADGEDAAVADADPADAGEPPAVADAGDDDVAVLETTGLFARAVREQLAELPTPAFDTEFEGEPVIAVPATPENVAYLEGIANRLLADGHTPEALGPLLRRRVPDDDTGMDIDAYLLSAEATAGSEIGGG